MSKIAKHGQKMDEKAVRNLILENEMLLGFILSLPDEFLAALYTKRKGAVIPFDRKNGGGKGGR